MTCGHVYLSRKAADPTQMASTRRLMRLRPWIVEAQHTTRLKRVRNISLTFGLVFSIFSAFDSEEQNALIAFDSCFGAPLKNDLRIRSSISTALIVSGCLSIFSRTAVVAEASGCQRPPPVNHRVSEDASSQTRNRSFDKGAAKDGTVIDAREWHEILDTRLPKFKRSKA
jgi:hypothetical protein